MTAYILPLAILILLFWRLIVWKWKLQKDAEGVFILNCELIINEVENGTSPERVIDLYNQTYTLSFIKKNVRSSLKSLYYGSINKRWQFIKRDPQSQMLYIEL